MKFILIIAVSKFNIVTLHECINIPYMIKSSPPTQFTIRILVTSLHKKDNITATDAAMPRISTKSKLNISNTTPNRERIEYFK